MILPEQPAESLPLGPPSPAHDILAGLNDRQLEAVRHTSGPLLVLAGAGSGKTRVIVRRIAHLVLELGVKPWRIVAVTFTNKAAGEMRERVLHLLGERGSAAWVGTFHALCLRILRRDGAVGGLASGFNVYDSDDQLAVIKRILREEASEEGAGTPRSFLSRISRAKNALQSPDEVEAYAHTPDRKFHALVYRRYEETLARSNAVDFDDLLLRTIRLFREHPEVAEGYASRCEHLLVDEYQDTNRPQYLLVRALSAIHGNICVVGDEDQCIYRFRGAELRNILEFETDHPGARTIRLEQNYRSTATILEAASAIIANNVQRKGKRLWTNNARGEKIELCRAPDDRTEAVWVAQRVRELQRMTPYEGITVLYRTNAQSRQFEEIFRRDGIPYQVVGSVQFYERKEIKDLLAYLKLSVNPADDVSFRRVVNTPPRGIGEGTLATLEQVARARSVSLMQAAAFALEQNLVTARAAKTLRTFVDLMETMSRRAAEDAAPEIVESFVESIGYEGYLDKAYGPLASERMENVRALTSAAVEYAEESESSHLQGFLDRSALVSDADEVGRRPGVTLMTIHNAKGLEFPAVFLTGLEENLFPHAMASGSEDDIEEERRLCYVALTRARERLFLAHARFRRLQGALLPSRPSRFLDEFPEDTLEVISLGGEGFFDSWSVRSGGERFSSGSSAAHAAIRPATRPPRPASAPVAEVSKEAEDAYRIGVFVRHPRFGAGRIVDREGAGKNLKLTIQFADQGAKKILPAYTQLQVEV